MITFFYQTSQSCCGTIGKVYIELMEIQKKNGLNRSWIGFFLGDLCGSVVSRVPRLDVTVMAASTATSQTMKPLMVANQF